MNRRNFLYNASLFTLASVANANASTLNKSRIITPGIQLYMVSDDMTRDANGTLKQLASMGYQELESYGSDKGIYWGKSNKDFQKLVTDMGMRLVSTHYNPCTLAEFEKLAAGAAEIGMKQIICPWLGPQKSIEVFKKFADGFNQRGAICKKHGLRYGYHPHDYPYKKVDGQLPIDVLLANTDKELVHYQLDVYYAVTESADPYAYIKKYKGRFTSMHMRDVLKKRLPAGSKEESACDLGEGIVNYPKLIAEAKATGMKHFFVEQSRYYHQTPLQSAKKNAAYLKSMRLT